MSSLDIYVCVGELQEIVGGKVEKVYHYPPNEIRFKIHAKGRKDLVVEAGKRIHLTIFPRESPRFPSPFAMLLRKHLENCKIVSIKQHDFDRVVVIDFSNGKKVVVELFGRGNVLLTNENFEVIMDIRGGKGIYEFPRKKAPFEFTLDELRCLCGERREIVKILAVKLGLGGLLAEEVCLRAKVEKDKIDIDDEEIERIYSAVRSIFDPVLKGYVRPQIVLKNGSYLDVTPIDLEIYRGFKRRYFESFNRALDEFYSKAIVEEEVEYEEIERLRRRLEIQLERKRELEEEVERCRELGDFIYERFKFFEDVLRRLRDGERVEFVKEVGRDYVVVNLDGRDVRLDLNLDIHGIAKGYYERAKKAREKLEGLLVAIEKTKKEIEDFKKLRYKTPIRIARRREWFERFRWFLTSDGFLAIGGRNAKMNEEIVSRYLESKDLFFHTQAPGAPVVVLKRGQEAPKKSLVETAQFSAIYSSLWKSGVHSGEVYYVKPEQVKRSAKAGEYLPRGSFYIVGSRNYINVDLRCAIGVDLSNLRVMGGPTSAVARYCDYYVILEIGEKDFNEVSVEVARTIVERARDDEKLVVKAIATPDEIAKFLPPGRSRIVGVYP